MNIYVYLISILACGTIGGIIGAFIYIGFQTRFK